MDLIGVGKSQLGFVVAKLLGGGDAQLVQGWLQLLKIQSQSLNCFPLQTAKFNSAWESTLKNVEISYLCIY